MDYSKYRICRQIESIDYIMEDLGTIKIEEWKKIELINLLEEVKVQLSNSIADER